MAEIQHTKILANDFIAEVCRVMDIDASSVRAIEITAAVGGFVELTIYHLADDRLYEITRKLKGE